MTNANEVELIPHHSEVTGEDRGTGAAFLGVVFPYQLACRSRQLKESRKRNDRLVMMLRECSESMGMMRGYVEKRLSDIENE